MRQACALARSTDGQGISQNSLSEIVCGFAEMGMSLSKTFYTGHLPLKRHVADQTHGRFLGISSPWA